MQRLTLWLDPHLTRHFNAEIAWTWRLVLSAAGIRWEQVSAEDSRTVDVAYVSRASPHNARPRAQLEILADITRWEQASALRLDRVGELGEVTFLEFEKMTRTTPVASRADGTLRVAHDLIFDLFWFSVHREETFWPRNVHGHLDFSGSVFLEQQLFVRGVGSEIVMAIERLLIPLARCAPVNKWPSGKAAAACASHDVDYPDVVKAIEPLRMVKRNGWRSVRSIAPLLAGTRHHWHFESWVAKESALGICSAFYFVARQGSLWQYATGRPDPFYDITSPRFAELFRYLRGEGIEIGIQPSYRAHQDPSCLGSERALLEEASKGPVTGGRHHYLRLDLEHPLRTLAMHAAAGFEYDSSLTHDRYPGWRSGLSCPFFPFDPEQRTELTTLQIPMAWMDAQLFRRRARNPGVDEQLLERLVAVVRRQHGCLMVDVHEYVLDPVLFPGWAQRYLGLLEHVRESGEFWLATPAEVATYRRNRYHAIRAESVGLL